MRSYGLILPGGGAKGAYQIGAWSALREMRIKFSAIAGVSIGSINGALIASNKYEEALDMWSTVRVEHGVNITESLKEPDNLFSSKNYTALFKEILRNGGIDASPTKDFLSQYIDENAVRKSKIPLGLITYQLSTMNPLELFTKDIPEGELIDYILASCKVPGVSKIGPEGEIFLDGGVYDNIPLSVLKKRGINNLIIIDISVMKGWKHQTDAYSCAQIVNIRPYNSDELGAIFDFSPEMAMKRMTMGYLDAKKAFGELQGNVYHFSPRTFSSLLKKYGPDTVLQLEKLAFDMGLARVKVYKEKDFINTVYELYLQREAAREEKESAEENKGFLGTIVKKWTGIVNTKNDFELAYELLETMKK
ncbi:MAG: patatin-like phospholipase family protein [Clostridia bacterium]|nr:patatin-like phospholipase family protein [Clostridia bacterium]